jgi:hypothetical protein
LIIGAGRRPALSSVEGLGAIGGAVSLVTAATRTCPCCPGFVMTAAPAHSALSPAVPSFASITASTSFCAPVRSIDTGLGASPRCMTSDSNTFFPSTHAPNTTLPPAGGGAGAAPGGPPPAGGGPSSTPTVETNFVAAPARSIATSPSDCSGNACGYVTPPSL